MKRRATASAIDVIPLANARTGGCLRVLRIKGKQHNFIDTECSELCVCSFCRRIPVSHGDLDVHFRSALREKSEKTLGLLPRLVEDWRGSPKSLIQFPDLRCAKPGDQRGQGLAKEKGAGEIDDIRIAEQVVEERPDGIR